MVGNAEGQTDSIKCTEQTQYYVSMRFNASTKQRPKEQTKNMKNDNFLHLGKTGVFLFHRSLFCSLKFFEFLVVFFCCCSSLLFVFKREFLYVLFYLLSSFFFSRCLFVAHSSQHFLHSDQFSYLKRISSDFFSFYFASVFSRAHTHKHSFCCCFLFCH